MEKFFIAVVALLALPLIHVVVGLFLAFPIMWSYNGFAPNMFSLAEMDYLQAFSVYFFSYLILSNASSKVEVND